VNAIRRKLRSFVAEKRYEIFR